MVKTIPSCWGEGDQGFLSHLKLMILWKEKNILFILLPIKSTLWTTLIVMNKTSFFTPFYSCSTYFWILIIQIMNRDVIWIQTQKIIYMHIYYEGNTEMEMGFTPTSVREKKKIVNFRVSFAVDFPLHIDPIWNWLLILLRIHQLLILTTKLYSCLRLRHFLN